MAFQLWYTNYFIDINSKQTIDPKLIPGIDELGEFSSNGDITAWHFKSQLREDDFKRHLTQLLTDNTQIDPQDVTVAKGIDGGPLKML